MQTARDFIEVGTLMYDLSSQTKCRAKRNSPSTSVAMVGELAFAAGRSV